MTKPPARNSGPVRQLFEVQRAARGRRIAVIGAGYVGVTLSASLALLGHGVECTDSSPGRVAELAGGRFPMVEDGLTELVARMLAAGRLRFGTGNARAAGRAEFVFLCLPTPGDADGLAEGKGMGIRDSPGLLT